MKKYLILAFALIAMLQPLCAQQAQLDTIAATELSEVIVVGSKSPMYQKQHKPLATVEDYLRQSGKVDMIRRGSYAWEPVLNSMATERIVVTIDGMRIFGACTDKMDPITSYIEVSNLSEAKVTSGQQGSCHGATIGGSIDLKRTQFNQAKTGWRGTVNMGFESNANQKILGASTSYSDSTFYFDTDITSRRAQNYTDGHGHEVLYSQFKKFNISATTGAVVQKNKRLEASLIYDKAIDVGYPALPMDVSLAEALITSLKFEYRPRSRFVDQWETKAYYNTITHRMDDTNRPDVPIHMDMPGWSNTCGFYSKASRKQGKNHFSADANMYYNQSRAEMTMYPTNPAEPLMFMDTWPDVRTRYAALFVQDEILAGNTSTVLFSATLANHFNRISSETGWESLRIFYPDLAKDNNRWLKSASAKYTYLKSGFEASVGIGYGERAPSVSEGYGFYLFNSFDRYDYVGNPTLHNEKSYEFHTALVYKTPGASVKVSGAWFHVLDYIVATPDPKLIAMTIGASGVKTVGALDYADIWNATIDANYQISQKFRTNLQLVYSCGTDNHGDRLPMISPVRYNGSIDYSANRLSGSLQVEGNTVQSQFSPAYGEDRTPAYAVVGLSAGYRLTYGKWQCHVKTGVENLLDAYYSTYSDWNNIPRNGRNVFVNLLLGLD